MSEASSNKRWINWVLALPCAIAVVWALGACFVSSVPIYNWDPEARVWTGTPGKTWFFSEEGWGTTMFGPNGLIGTDRLPDPSIETIAIYGDSYVQALHVDDRFKMHRQFDQLWANQHPDMPMQALAIGASGYHVLDYIDLIPRYEAILNEPSTTFIILHNPEDIMPADNPRYKNNDAEAVKRATDRGQASLRQQMYALQGNAPWVLMRRAKDLSVEFSVGPRDGASPPSNGGVQAQIAATPDDPSIQLFWEEVLTGLEQATQSPVVFVYLPHVPRLNSGRVVTEDEHDAFFAAFASHAEGYGMPLINGGQAFIAGYERTNRLPRGFPDTVPGKGHLNALGHEQVAGLLVRYVESRGAVQPD